MTGFSRTNAVILAAAVLLAACSPTPSPAPSVSPTRAPTATPTLAPSATSLPPATATPADTPTPAPTATPVPLPDEVLPGDSVRIPAGGFSFTTVQGYETSPGGKEASIQHASGDVLVNLGVRPLETNETPAEALQAFLDSIKKDVSDLETGEIHPAAAGGQAGVEASLSGTFYPGKVQGSALAVPAGHDNIFIALGFGKDEGKNLWEAQGQQVYQSIIDSLAFFPPEIVSACTVSTDPTYGLTPENPILIGGEVDEGLQREKAFLDNLRGPNGEAVRSYRMVTTNVNGLIVDIYLVTYEGLADPVELFLTSYEYNDPTAPLGFICGNVVPFGEPGTG